MDMFFGVWIGLIVVFVAFAAFMARLSFASKPTAEDNLADDRWFKVTQWMDADEKWKDDVDNAIDNLDALHTWTEKVAGQLEKIESFFAPKFVTGMMTPAAYVTSTMNNAGRAVQGNDGLVWTDVQPKEAGYYWFTGTWTIDGDPVRVPVTAFVVDEDGDAIQVDYEGYVAEFELDDIVFKGWWAKMEVPEFKEPK